MPLDKKEVKEFDLDELEDDEWSARFGELREKERDINRQKERLNHEAQELWMDFRDEFELDGHEFNYDYDTNKVTAKPAQSGPTAQRGANPQPKSSAQQLKMRQQVSPVKKSGGPINRLMGWLGLN